MTTVIGHVLTPEGEAARVAGLEEAQRRNAGVVILNSPRKGAPVDASLASEEQFARLLAQSKDANLEARVLHPTHTAGLAQEVLDIADEVEAELIVIGLRRRTAVGKFIMGSHAQSIVLQTELPVLAVKPKTKAS